MCSSNLNYTEVSMNRSNDLLLFSSLLHWRMWFIKYCVTVTATLKNRLRIIQEKIKKGLKSVHVYFLAADMIK